MGDSGRPEKSLLAPSHRGAETQRKPRTSQRGWYLLEYAVVVFGVAFFIVGFSDIARIFHARGAVRAGVTEGLRCLYPTDPECSTQNLSNGWFPAQRFNAQVTGGDQSNNYELPRVSYQLASSWFNEPVSEASFATKRLTQVTLTQPQDAYRQYQVLYPGVAHAVYVLKTRELPRVEPGNQSDAKEAIIEPRFVDPETGDSRAADKRIDNISLSLRTGNSSAREISSSIIISEDDILQNAAALNSLQSLQAAYGFTAACYQGSRTSLPNGEQLISWPAIGVPARCAYRNNPSALYNGSAMQVPIMIHVSGDAKVSAVAPSIKGKVGLTLEHDGKSVDLGARVFSRESGGGEGQFGSFVVRGAGYNDKQEFDVSDSYREKCEEAEYHIDLRSPQDPGECRKYITLPLIKVGKPLKLKFRLTWSQEGGGSTPDVELSWTGRAKLFFPKFQATHEQRACGYSASPDSCGTSVAPMQVSFRTTNLEQEFSHDQRPENQCGLDAPSGYRPAIPEALESIRGEIILGARPLAPIAFWSKGLATDQCSPKSYNRSCTENPREYMKGCEPEYSMPGDATKLCSLSDYRPKRDTISNPAFAYGKSDRLESRGGCTGEAFPACAQQYLATKSPVFLGAISNGCSVAQPVNVEPFNSGPLHENTCTDTLAGFIEEYREKNSVPSGIEVAARQNQETPVISPEPPTNLCWNSKPISKDTRRTWMCAESAPYAVANKCCQTYGQEHCTIDVVNVGDGGGSAGGFEQVVTAARERAFTTVQTAYPAARMDASCGSGQDAEPSENGCLNIDAGPAENGTRARMRASMRVPLASFNLLGLDNHTVVQYEESRTLESALVGEVG